MRLVDSIYKHRQRKRTNFEDKPAGLLPLNIPYPSKKTFFSQTFKTFFFIRKNNIFPFLQKPVILLQKRFTGENTISPSMDKRVKTDLREYQSLSESSFFTVMKEVAREYIDVCFYDYEPIKSKLGSNKEIVYSDTIGKIKRKERI